jgi:CHAT domain-containing protein
LTFKRPAAVRQIDPTDTLLRAKHLAWLSNWAEASRVLDRTKRSGRLGTDESTLIFAKAVEIRGNIEALSLPAAAKELDEILATGAAQTDPGLRLQILAMKGDVEFQYDLRAAEKTWTEVGQLAEKSRQYVWEARAGGELGCVAFLNGEVNTALRRVVTAYFKAEVSGDVAEKMKTLTALGEGLAEFGRPADAVRFFTRVLELSAANRDAYFPFTAYVGKARLLLATPAPGEGRQMLAAGLADARRERMRVREARILIVLGADALRAGDRESAVRLLGEAVDVARQAGLHRIEAEAGARLASALSAGGDLDNAAAYAKTSVAAAERAGDVYHLPQQLAALGEIESNRGDLTAAKTAYEDAIRRVTSLFSDLPDARHENTVVATMGGVFQGYFELALNKANNPGLAFEILESARARGLVDRIRQNQSAAQNGGRRDPAMIKRVADLNRRLLSEQGFADRGQLLDRLWETELRSLCFDRGPSEPQPGWTTKPVSLRELQSKLGPGELLIEYSLGQSRSSAFAISHDHAAPYALRGRKEIESAIARQLKAIEKRQDGKPEGKAVYALLLAPIAPLAQSTRLIIVPDGKVNMAPLGAAVDVQGRYLVETRVVSFAPSATAFSLLATPTRQTPRKVEVLGIGGARYPAVLGLPGPVETRTGGFFALAPPTFSKLARSGTEVADLAAARNWETLSITGDNATESVFKRLPLSNFDVLHFSLHSAIDRDFPDRSGLVLTAHGGAQEDDLLQAREIMGLKLNADLVTLSACDGAAGTPEGMAGTNSLVQAFLIAGARSVVASVWEADDVFTAALMRRFYANLRLGHDKAEALTLANRELLKEWGSAAAPALWAGFRIVGDAHGTITGESD